MGKKVFKIAIVIIAIFLIILGIVYLIDLDRMNNNKPVLFSTWVKEYNQTSQEEEKEETKGETKGETKMNVVLSLEDKISDNTAWCGTFNLIWNDLKNDLAKQDIVFTPQLEMVKNLNKGTFNTSYLSEESYYKVCETPSLELKEKIKKALKEKFNETSEIIDEFNWTEHTPEDYFLYVMLKKQFEFPKEFTQLEDSTFRQYKNVKYFGINTSTDEEVRKQVKALYYNSDEEFAIKLLTKENDEVIISRGTSKDTFGSIFEEVMEKSEGYEKGNFGETDILKIPNISFHLKEELTELQNKKFQFSNGKDYYIEKAMQTIEFDLDKKGGKIKSEAGMIVNLATSIKPKEPRKFIVDDTFVIFLKEKDKDLPYFAAKISDISKVQNDL